MLQSLREEDEIVNEGDGDGTSNDKDNDSLTSFKNSIDRRMMTICIRSNSYQRKNEQIDLFLQT